MLLLLMLLMPPRSQKHGGTMKAAMSNHMVLVIIALLFVAIFASFWFALSLAPTPKTITGVTTTIAPVGGYNPSCSTNNNPTFLVSCGYPDYSKPQVIQANGKLGPPITLVGSQTVNIYAQQPYVSTTPTNIISSSSSGALATGTLSCNTNYLITCGDNSAQFLNGTIVNTGQATSQTVQIVSAKYSAPTLTASNSVTTTSTAPFIFSAGSTKVLTGYLIIQAGQYNASQGPLIVTVTYNSLDYQQPQLGSLSPMTPSIPPPSFVTSNTNDPELILVGKQNNFVSFQIPSLVNSQYSTGTGTSTGLTLVPLTLTAVGTGAGTNEIFGVQLTQTTQFFNTSSGRLNVVYDRNPITGAALFTVVSTTNALIARPA